MRSSMIIMLFITLPLLFYFAVVYTPDTKDYSIYNTQWNGLSKFYHYVNNEGVKVIVKHTKFSPSDVRLLNNNTCILIISPELEYTSIEIELLINFVKSGGTIIIMDDFGKGDCLLEKMNIPLRFGNAPLLDNVFYSKQPIFPIIVGIHFIGLENYTLLLDIPTYLVPLNQKSAWSVSLVAFSLENSFIDTNWNFKKDKNEKYDIFPVIAIAKLGNGRVIIFSDSSILINCVIDKYDNFTIFLKILKYYHIKTLIIDYAHYSKSTLEFIRSYILTFSALVRTFLSDSLISFTLSLLIMIIIVILMHTFIRGCKHERM